MIYIYIVNQEKKKSDVEIIFDEYVPLTITFNQSPNLKKYIRIEWKPGRVVKGIQRYEVTGIRDGVEIFVVTDGSDIITAYPIGR